MRERCDNTGGRSAGRRALAVVLAVFALVAWATEAGAEPIAAERPAKIVVAPSSFRAFGPISDDEFEYGVGAAARRGVTRYLANHDETFDLVSAEAFRELLRGQSQFEDKLSVAKGFAKIGTDRYKHLQTEEAIQKLENAVEKYGEIQYGLVAPKRVAEVLKYLALSYLNEGDNAARPLEVMKRMVRLHPSGVLRSGFYPDRVASFYRTARQDVVGRLRKRGPSPERAQTLVEFADAELAVFGGVFPVDEGDYRTKLFVYSRRKEGFVEPESAVGEDVGRPEMRRAGNRLMARFASCVYQPTDDEANRTIVESTGTSPFSTHLTFTYASFLEYPDAIEKPFGNAGVGIGGHLALTEEFGIGVGFNLLSSFRDFSGRILENFSTLRAFVGPDIGIDVGRFNFGLSARAEVAHIGAFRICSDEFIAPQRECPGQARQSYPELDVLLGFNSRPRVRFDLFGSFDLVAAASFTTFLLPAARPLNNPFAGEFGIRYRF